MGFPKQNVENVAITQIEKVKLKMLDGISSILKQMSVCLRWVF